MTLIGKMQEWPLTVDKILTHAKLNYPQPTKSGS